MGVQWNRAKAEMWGDEGYLYCQYPRCTSGATDAHHTYIQANKKFAKFVDVIDNMSGLCKPHHAWADFNKWAWMEMHSRITNYPVIDWLESLKVLCPKLNVKAGGIGRIDRIIKIAGR